MNTFSTKIKLYFISSTIILLFTAFAFANPPEKEISKTFDVSGGGLLTIDSETGSIEVDSHNSNKVEVEVYKRHRSYDDDDELDDFVVEMNKNGNNVEVIGEYKSGWRRNRGLRVRFVVKVPKDYNVDLKTSGGSISVSDLKGDVKVRTSGGSLTFGEISGPINGRTSGGSIQLEGCKGDVNVKTSGGSIRLGDVDGQVYAHTSGGSIRINKARGFVDASTSGGSIHVEEVIGKIDANTSGGSVTAYLKDQPKSDCRLTTSGGSVTVYLEDDVKIDVDAKTSRGRVKSDFDITSRGTLRKNRVIGEINGGGPEMYLRTSGGNIKLLKM